MNIFTKKISKTEDQSLPLDPIELYQSCPYKEGYGYLRSIQEEVLRDWHAIRIQRDVICKMNTGSGKTLTGLLMLYSKLLENKEPALYVCPDSQLVDQTVDLAALYGIPVCVFDSSKDFPGDFLNSKKILICNFHKLFNGKSIFNRDNIKVGSLILDDAHKCVDIAREQSTLKLPRKHEISNKLFSLFQNALKFQAPGSFHRLEGGDPFMMMKVPYWTWIDNHERIIKILNTYVSACNSDETKFPNTDGILFKWNFIADNILRYDCYISGENVEITPIHVPYHEVRTFNEASHRYILSATFEDDYDLIKDLGITYQSILNPIVPKDRKDIGKRLILAPSRFDPKLDEKKLKSFISQYPKEGINTVVLSPSFGKSQSWIDVGAELVDKNNIDSALDKLATTKGNFLVFNNRYDGIDLHGDLCRVLIIDSLPLYSTLQEQYAEMRLESLRAGKKSQIIEQGLGRGVRSGGDYCVVFLMGNDLMNFLGYEKNLKYFTPITRGQLSMGLKLLDGESTRDSLKTIKDTASFCLSTHIDWVKFHTTELSKVQPDEIDARKMLRLKLAEIERLSLIEFKQRNYEKAAEIITKQLLISDAEDELSAREKAWYYQFAAQLVYLGNRSTSNDFQSKACNISGNMFHPQDGHIFKKILRKGAQASIVKQTIAQFGRPQDIIIHINGILNELKYDQSIESNHFENKLSELGKLLGYNSQLPEKELGNGPDVLWCMTDNHYLILEAKSRSTHSEISRDNIEQLLHSEVWFKHQYGTEMEYTLVTLQNSNRKGNNVNTHDKIKVLDKERLELLHNNLSQFATALQSNHTKAHTDEEVAKLLESYKFTPSLFRATFLNSIK